MDNSNEGSNFLKRLVNFFTKPKDIPKQNIPGNPAKIDNNKREAIEIYKKNEQETKEKHIKTVENLISDFKLNHKDPSANFALALSLIRQYNLGSDLLNQLIAAYLETMTNLVKQFAESYIHSWVSKEEEELLKKTNEHFEQSFGDILKSLIEFDDKHKICNKAENLFKAIEQDPNSEMAKEASREFMNEAKDKEAFKKKLIAAQKDIQKLEDDRGKLIGQYDDLKTLINKDEKKGKVSNEKLGHKNTLLEKIGNGIDYIEGKIEQKRQALKKAKQCFDAYLEAEVEVKENAPEEVKINKFRDKLFNSIEKEKDKDKLNELNKEVDKTPNDHDKNKKFNDFAAKLTNSIAKADEVGDSVLPIVGDFTKKIVEDKGKGKDHSKR